MVAVGAQRRRGVRLRPARSELFDDDHGGTRLPSSEPKVLGALLR